MNKKIILVVLAMVVALALVGCTAQNVLGGTTWKATGKQARVYLSFAKDSTCTLKMEYISDGTSFTRSGTWSANGNDLTINLSAYGTMIKAETVNYTVEIKGDTMKLAISGEEMEFTKVK